MSYRQIIQWNENILCPAMKKTATNFLTGAWLSERPSGKACWRVTTCHDNPSTTEPWCPSYVLRFTGTYTKGRKFYQFVISILYHIKFVVTKSQKIADRDDKNIFLTRSNTFDIFIRMTYNHTFSFLNIMYIHFTKDLNSRTIHILYFTHSRFDYRRVHTVLYDSVPLQYAKWYPIRQDR